MISSREQVNSWNEVDDDASVAREAGILWSITARMMCIVPMPEGKLMLREKLSNYLS